MSLVKRIRKPKTGRSAKAEADRAFSWAVREAADWCCQFIERDPDTGTYDSKNQCGLYFEPPNEIGPIMDRPHKPRANTVENSGTLEQAIGDKG